MDAGSRDCSARQADRARRNPAPAALHLGLLSRPPSRDRPHFRRSDVAHRPRMGTEPAPALHGDHLHPPGQCGLPTSTLPAPAPTARARHSDLGRNDASRPDGPRGSSPAPRPTRERHDCRLRRTARRREGLRADARRCRCGAHGGLGPQLPVRRRRQAGSADPRTGDSPSQRALPARALAPGISRAARRVRRRHGGDGSRGHQLQHPVKDDRLSSRRPADRRSGRARQRLRPDPRTLWSRRGGPVWRL